MGHDTVLTFFIQRLQTFKKNSCHVLNIFLLTSFFLVLILQHFHIYAMGRVRLLCCFCVEKFPYLSNNDLKGKVQLTLDEVRFLTEFIVFL